MEGHTFSAYPIKNSKKLKAMIAIPLIYFIFLFAWFWSRHRVWNMDLAATSLLIVISFCAIMIDINDIYDDYGINEKNITILTLILFCFQWTLVLIPLHLFSRIPLHKHFPIKEKMLYVFFFIVTLSSFLMILVKAGDIKEALIMDVADVRGQHYKDLASGSDSGSNYLLLPANILTTTPFPTLALFFWFYMKTFMKSSVFLRAGILIASIVQAILSIVMAGRAALVYWTFDFFLMFSYFYQYLPKVTKRKILLITSAFASLVGFMLIYITLARFDGSDSHRDPFESLYGYAGQHVNNFCTMIIHGGDAPITFDRIFPLLSKISGHTFDLFDHYDAITAHLSSNIYVNVFDTFGGEIFLDLGWFGYIIFFILLIIATFYIKNYWQEMTFNRVFILVIMISFFTRGLFAWPFTGHYTTMALALTLSCCYLFKYAFKI